MSEDSNLSESDKKAVLRSAAYPNITIEEAISIVSQIKKSFPVSQFDRDDVMGVLKRTNITRDIGAAVQYGLLDKATGQGYKLSQRVQSIINFVTDQERQEAIVECFKTPKLYAELIERFRGHVIPADQQLRAIVIRYHGITEAAAPQAMDVFIQNAIYCGILSENRILMAENETQISLKPVENNFSLPKFDNTPVPKGDGIFDSPVKQFLLEEINGMTDLKIHLTEKKIARLVYPDKLNEKDIQILKLQLEALALTL